MFGHPDPAHPRPRFGGLRSGGQQLSSWDPEIVFSSQLAPEQLFLRSPPTGAYDKVLLKNEYAKRRLQLTRAFFRAVSVSQLGFDPETQSPSNAVLREVAGLELEGMSSRFGENADGGGSDEAQAQRSSWGGNYQEDGVVLTRGVSSARHPRTDGRRKLRASFEEEETDPREALIAPHHAAGAEYVVGEFVPTGVENVVGELVPGTTSFILPANAPREEDAPLPKLSSMARGRVLATPRRLSAHRSVHAALSFSNIFQKIDSLRHGYVLESQYPSTYILAPSARNANFTHMVRNATARALFCGNGDSDPFAPVSAIVNQWDIRVWGEVRPLCRNQQLFDTQLDRIRIVDLVPGYLDVENANSYAVPEVAAPSGVASSNPRPVPSVEANELQFDSSRNKFLPGHNCWGNSPAQALADDAIYGFAPRNGGPTFCQDLCARNLTVNNFRCTGFTYDRGAMVCQWMQDRYNWQLRQVAQYDCYAVMGITVLFSISQNRTDTEPSAVSLLAKLQSKLANPRSDFRSDADIREYSRSASGLTEIMNMFPPVQIVASTSTPSTTMGPNATTTAAPVSPTIASEIECPENEIALDNKTCVNDTRYENYTAPWWVFVEDYLPFRQDIFCESRMIVNSPTNFSFHSDLSQAQAEPFRMPTTVPPDYGTTTTTTIGSGPIAFVTTAPPIPYNFYQVAPKDHEASSSVGVVPLGTPPAPFHSLDGDTTYRLDFFVKLPPGRDPTILTKWAMDTWDDPTFVPTDENNFALGNLPKNTNDFLGQGPGWLGLLNSSSVVSNHTPPSSEILIGFNLTTASLGVKLLLYAQENFTWPTDLVLEGVPVKNLGKANMTLFEIRKSEKTIVDLLNADQPELAVNVDKWRKRQYAWRDVIEISCPEHEWKASDSDTMVQSNGHCLNKVQPDPWPITLRILTPRNLQMVTEFFYESYDVGGVLLGWGTVEGTSLTSLEAQIVYPKMSQVRENTIGIVVKTRVEIPRRSKLIVKTPTQLFLSCYSLDAFWLEISACREGGLWEDFAITFNNTVPAGKILNLGVVVMKTPPKFDIREKRFNVMIERANNENVNLDVRHDLQDFDGEDMMVPGLFVERPFPPGFACDSDGNMELYVNFLETTSQACLNITIDLPLYSLLMDGGGGLMSVDSLGEDGAGLGSGAAGDVAGGEAGGENGTEAAEGAIMPGAMEASAPTAPVQVQQPQCLPPCTTTTTTSTTSTVPTRADGTPLARVVTPNPKIWYERHPILPTKTIVVNTDERKAIVFVVNKRIRQGRYAIKFQISGNYFELSALNRYDALDRSIYVRLFFEAARAAAGLSGIGIGASRATTVRPLYGGRATTTTTSTTTTKTLVGMVVVEERETVMTFSFGGSHVLQKHELDPLYALLRHPDAKVSGSRRRFGGGGPVGELLRWGKAVGAAVGDLLRWGKNSVVLQLRGQLRGRVVFGGASGKSGPLDGTARCAGAEVIQLAGRSTMGMGTPTSSWLIAGAGVLGIVLHVLVLWSRRGCENCSDFRFAEDAAVELAKPNIFAGT